MKVLLLSSLLSSGLYAPPSHFNAAPDTESNVQHIGDNPTLAFLLLWVGATALAVLYVEQANQK